MFHVKRLVIDDVWHIAQPLKISDICITLKQRLQASSVSRKTSMLTSQSGNMDDSKKILEVSRETIPYDCHTPHW